MAIAALFCYALILSIILVVTYRVDAQDIDYNVVAGTPVKLHKPWPTEPQEPLNNPWPSEPQVKLYNPWRGTAR